jgi:hypothetical protein
VSGGWGLGTGLFICLAAEIGPVHFEKPLHPSGYLLRGAVLVFDIPNWNCQHDCELRVNGVWSTVVERIATHGRAPLLHEGRWDWHHDALPPTVACTCHPDGAVLSRVEKSIVRADRRNMKSTGGFRIDVAI